MSGPGAPALRRVAGHAELLEVCGGSSFVRYDLPVELEGPAYAVGRAVAVPRRTHTGRLGLLLMGPGSDLETLVRTLVQRGLLDSRLRAVTVERAAFPVVSRLLPLGDGNDWEWLLATAPPPPASTESRLVALSQADRADIDGLLGLANPGTDARPFAHPGQHWVGVRDEGGTLVACGVREPGLAGWPVLSGITVHPEHRGRGLGVAVTARLTREAVLDRGCARSACTRTTTSRAACTSAWATGTRTGGPAGGLPEGSTGRGSVLSSERRPSHPCERTPMPTLTSADVEIHYEDSAGDGRPVVLVHGWPLSGASWSELADALRQAGYRVVTYDRRGFGESGKPGAASGYDYDTLTADLDALVRELDLRDMTLVGFSMGGGEVARYAGRYGEERLHSVVFASAIPPCLLKDDDHPDGALDLDTVAGMQQQLRADREGFLDGFLTTFYSADGQLKVTEEQRQEALRLAGQADLHAAAECIRSWVTDFTADLAAITVPTLVLHGDSDAIVPFEVSGRRTHEAVAGSRLVVIEQGPHGVNTSHPEQVNAAVLDFLGSAG